MKILLKDLLPLIHKSNELIAIVYCSELYLFYKDQEVKPKILNKEVISISDYSCVMADALYIEIDD